MSRYASILIIFVLFLSLTAVSCGGSTVSDNQDTPSPSITEEPAADDNSSEDPQTTGLNGAVEIYGAIETPEGNPLAGATVYIPSASSLNKAISVADLSCDDPEVESCAATCTDDNGEFVLDTSGCEADSGEVVIQYQGEGQSVQLNCAEGDSCGLGIIAFIVEEPLEGGLSDTTPAELVELSISPSSVDASAGPVNVTVTARITDDLSGNGDYTTQMRFMSPSGNQFVDAIFTEDYRISGDMLDGVYEYTMTIPQYAESGVWVANYFLSYDNVGNIQYYYYDDLVDALGVVGDFEQIGE